MLARRLAAAPTLEDLTTAVRLTVQLPYYLRHPLTQEQARRMHRERLANREANFLAQARFAIYGKPNSPYRRLLQMVGCESGDFTRLVEQEGIEGALI